MYVHAHRTERVNVSEGREGASGVGGGARIRGGNGDGNGVEGGNGDVNGYTDGNGAGKITALEENEGTQY